MPPFVAARSTGENKPKSRLQGVSVQKKRLQGVQILPLVTMNKVARFPQVQYSI
jgi:hypothetical protein